MSMIMDNTQWLICGYDWLVFVVIGIDMTVLSQTKPLSSQDCTFELEKSYVDGSMWRLVPNFLGNFSPSV